MVHTAGLCAMNFPFVLSRANMILTSPFHYFLCENQSRSREFFRPCYFTASHKCDITCRIAHEKTQQSSNGVVSHLQSSAENDSAEEDFQTEEVAEDGGEEEGDESDDVCLFHF
jgi:hypothetical protein